MKKNNKIKIRIGHKIRSYEEDEHGVLCQTSSGKVSLIDVVSGNRWREAVKVKDPYDINADELGFILGEDLSEWEIYFGKRYINLQKYLNSI